ncbi:phenylacetone monooxygenase [Naviculisporaceae sp. PSN 640]
MTTEAKKSPAVLPAGENTVSVKMIDPTRFGPADMSRFMGPMIENLGRPDMGCSLSFLIEHPSGRKLVFDLGIRKDPENLAPKISSYLPSTRYTIKSHNVVDILEEGGIKGEEIEAVIWSHWHWDHIGDPSSFPPSTDLVVGPGFKEAMLPGAPANPDSPVQESDYANRTLREITFPTSSPQVSTIGSFPAFDYFGDGSFYLLDSPGHAIGHLCGFARTTPGDSSTSTFILMGGDICHYAGIFRPSEYLPMPDKIIPHPCCTHGENKDMNLALCPGSSWVNLQTSRGRKANQPLFDMTFGGDIPLAMKTAGKLMELDCLDNVFVIIAHDTPTKNHVPKFNKHPLDLEDGEDKFAQKDLTLNDWKAQGWGQRLKWAWLADLRSYWEKSTIPAPAAEISNAELFDRANAGLDYDVLIIGGGLSGLYSLLKIRNLGLRVKVLEAGEAEGGTWFWNRYPGARFDSESFSYIFSFSQELLDEWDWTEQFSPQPETLRYIQFVTKKFDLKKDMIFNTRIQTAHFQTPGNHWLLTDQSGKTYTARYVVTAMGILNQPTLPDIPGVESYAGQAWHTARWPFNSSAELAGKRVGIIGTGATAIQTIQEIYKTCGSLTVFQRTPNWTAPLRNSKITPDEMANIRKRYPEIFQKCLESYSCFVHMVDPRNTTEMTREELYAKWEELYALPGFSKVLGVSKDIFTDKTVNKLYSDFHADKIRARINDPVLAEKLIPKCHGFGTRRTPLESGYYEAFNEPHVKLVDIKNDDPIERITPKGILLKSGVEHEFDILIYATGFDAVTGSFNAVDFQGINGQKLKDTWANGIQTYLGLTVKDFPNMFMVMGPHQMFGNIPRSIEYAVEWVSDYIQWARENNITYCEARQEDMDRWYKHVEDCGKGLLSNEVDSWMTGVNKNLKHKQVRSLTRYNGPAPGYRKRCDEVKARGYSDFVLA